MPLAQWSIGNFTASGVSLWGLLAPIGAILFCGVRESIAWFAAYIFMTALSGFFDCYLADAIVQSASSVPIRIASVFFCPQLHRHCRRSFTCCCAWAGKGGAAAG